MTLWIEKISHDQNTMTLALFLIQASKIMRTLRTKVGG